MLLAYGKTRGICYLAQPLNLNLEEIRVIRLLDEAKVARLALQAWRRRHIVKPVRRWHKLGLTATLTLASIACTVAHSAPAAVPAPPPTCSARPIRVLLVDKVDAKGRPVEGPVMALDTAICVCSDNVVRACK